MLPPSTRVVQQDLDQLPSSVCNEDFGNSLLENLLMLHEQQDNYNDNNQLNQQPQMSPYEMPMIVEGTSTSAGDLNVLPMDTGSFSFAGITTSTPTINNTPAIPTTVIQNTLNQMAASKQQGTRRRSSSSAQHSSHPTPSSTPPSPYSGYIIASGSMTPGVITPGVMTPGVMTPGVMTPGAMTPGVMTPGVVTPANTPCATPLVSPHSSKPGSPRGSRYRRHQHTRRSISKEKLPDGTSTPGKSSTTEKLPRHKRPSHIMAEHKRRSKIQVKFLTIRGT